MLSIGAFSKMSNVTPNALRYYDEIGLIKPAKTGENGYRYYEAKQLETIIMLNKLKAYGLSLEEIAPVLAEPENNELLLPVIRQKRRVMHNTVYKLEFALKQMEQDILNLERGISIMSYLDKIKVELKQKESQNILFIRKNMSTKEVGGYFAKLMEKIGKEELTALGDPINIFHHEEAFNPECYDNEVAIPVKENIDGTRILEGSLCATATLHGPYTELAAVYAKLQQWVESENYEIINDAYEIYITDPYTTAAEENITEVVFPVKKK